LSGFEVDLRTSNSVGHVGVIREGSTGNRGSETDGARLFSDVGCMNEALGGREPGGAVGGSGRCWVRGSAAFAGTHAVPFSEDHGGVGIPYPRRRRTVP
jgi:hypothetical protein